MAYFGDLAKAAHAIAVEKGWYDQKRTVPELLCLIHSEISEGLEAWRDGAPYFYTENGKPEGLSSEMADAIIRIADMAASIGLDLDGAIDAKMAYNKNRPYRHGGKLA